VTLPAGRVWVEAHADTSAVPGELERGVRRGAEAADDDLRDAGRDMGDAMADGMGGRLKSRIPGIARSVEREFGKRKIKADVDFDVDEGLIPDEIERAFSRVFKPGGPLDTLERGVGDAVSSGIGAGFNVSGRGPLIVLLLPFIGAIGALIAAAVQAVNGLISLLYLIPSLIGAIALQAGVLFLAFRGVGEAIAKAFSAKTPKEFEKALEGLSPPLQKFIRSLLPLRELFNDLSDLAQRNFFTAFGTVLASFAKFMRFNLVLAVDKLSTAFGLLFSQLVAFFEYPRFQEFFKGLIDSTEKWIQALGPALLSLLEGFTELGIAVKPFLDWFGAGVAKGIADFGKWLSGLSADKEFLAWLEDMKETLKATWAFLGKTIEALKVFAQVVDEAGGKEMIDQLMFLIDQIIIFLKTDFGKDSIRALLGLLLSLTVVAVILIGGFLSWLAILKYIGDFLAFLVIGIGKFFTETIPNIVEGFIEWVRSSGPRVYGAFTAAFEMARQAVAERLETIRQLVIGIPDRLRDIIANIGTFMYNAGRTFVQRMAQGILDTIPGPLRFAMFAVGAEIGDSLPKSPAKIGPLSGEGDPLKGGQRIIQRLITGMQMETPALAAASSQATGNIIFGPGSVRVGFEGAVPTQEQAQMTGMAAGRGITNAIAARNTRLQIRTM